MISPRACSSCTATLTLARQGLTLLLDMDGTLMATVTSERNHCNRSPKSLDPTTSAWWTTREGMIVCRGVPWRCDRVGERNKGPSSPPHYRMVDMILRPHAVSFLSALRHLPISWSLFTANHAENAFAFMERLTALLPPPDEIGANSEATVRLACYEQGGDGDGPLLPRKDLNRVLRVCRQCGKASTHHTTCSNDSILVDDNVNVFVPRQLVKDMRGVVVRSFGSHIRRRWDDEEDDEEKGMTLLDIPCEDIEDNVFAIESPLFQLIKCAAVRPHATNDAYAELWRKCHEECWETLPHE